MRWQYILAGILIIIIGFIADFFGYLAPIKNSMYASSKTVLVGFNHSTGGFFDFFKGLATIKKINQENSSLKEENLKLESSNAGLLEYKRQNEILRAQLNFASTNQDKKIIPAQIIAQPAAGFMHYITLNKGKADGAKEGNLVIFGDYLVGKVDKVLENYSQVLLITNNNCLVPVILQNSRATGILKGGLSGLSVEEIPLDIKIENGENILTRALESESIQGIMVGKVMGVVSKQSEIFQKVSVTSPIDFNKLEFVFIVQ